MIVAQKDLRKLMRPMHDGLAYGAGLVLFKEDRVQENKNDISICMDYNDASEFLAGQPYDKHEFVWGGLRDYYEAMALLEKHKIPMEDFVYRESLAHQYLDVGKVVATRTAADRLEWGIRGENIKARNYGLESEQVSYRQSRKDMAEHQSLLLSSRYGQGLLAKLQYEHPTFFASLSGNNKITNLKFNHMNENNLSFLARQVENTGYGKEHFKELRAELQKQNPAFTLYHQQDYGKDSTVSSLHFKKAENSDMYFFNNHTVILKNERFPDPIRQTFYVNTKGDNITLKEGYNLLAGRAIEKDLENREGEKYRAWLQLNFKETDKHGNYSVKQYHQNYGFDLEKSLLQLPLKLENPEEKKRLLESIQRGNRQLVTLNLQGTERKIAVEAAPQFKSLNYYDEHGKRLHLQSVLQTPEQAFGEKPKQQVTNTPVQTNTPAQTNTPSGTSVTNQKTTNQTTSPEGQGNGKEEKALKNSRVKEDVPKGQKEKQKRHKKLQP